MHPLVAVEEVDVERVAVLEPENDSPVSADSHGPEAFQVAFERVQAKARKVERLGRFGGVNRGKNALNFCPQHRVDPGRIAVFVEPPESSMPEAPDQLRTKTVQNLVACSPAKSPQPRRLPRLQ